MKRLLSLAVIAAAFSLVGPAQAGLFDDAEARQQIDGLKKELNGRLETVTNGQLDLAGQNEELRGEIARLRGQVEVLLNEVESLKNRQRDFYVDLDERLRRFETGAASAAGQGQGQNQGEGSAPAAAAPRGNYEAALNLLKEGRAAEALAELNAFITNNPEAPNLAAAHFWGGTAALQTKDVATATKHFNTVLGRWPKDSVAPDAMLGLANGQIAMGDQRAARRTLQSLIDRYPSSSAARTAKQHLSQ
jgi:tol-pal system protein YbgF